MNIWSREVVCRSGKPDCWGRVRAGNRWVVSPALAVRLRLRMLGCAGDSFFGGGLSFGGAHAASAVGSVFDLGDDFKSLPFISWQSDVDRFFFPQPKKRRGTCLKQAPISAMLNEFRFKIYYFDSVWTCPHFCNALVSQGGKRKQTPWLTRVGGLCVLNKLLYGYCCRRSTCSHY